MPILSEKSLSSEDLGNRYDVVICALGYERRSRYVAEKLDFESDIKIAIKFGFNEGVNYKDNKRAFEERGFEILNNSTVDLAKYLVEISEPSEEAIHVAVDISSMSKTMMANILSTLKVISEKRPITITTLYAPTAYYKARTPYPIQRSGPINSLLAGNISGPEKPLAALVGLGNEIGLAVGAVQEIEPSLLWTFSAIGIDDRFDSDIQKANKELFSLFELSDFQYTLTDPHTLRSDISKKIQMLKSTHRIVVVPMGPKIFSHMTIMTVLFSDDAEAAVWQFSSGTRAEAEDREAEGAIICHVAHVGDQKYDKRPK